MGQESAEPLVKCAFMAGLPSDVSIQLKSMAAVEKLGLDGLVTRARVAVDKKCRLDMRSWLFKAEVRLLHLWLYCALGS